MGVYTHKITQFITFICSCVLVLLNAHISNSRMLVNYLISFICEMFYHLYNFYCAYKKIIKK